jgi:hypothetical protein
MKKIIDNHYIRSERTILDLKSLITLVVLLVAATQINAQQIDSRCYKTYDYAGVEFSNPNNINVDISKAKSEAGDKHEKFTVIAQPKVQDRAVVAIKQKGTWWKAILGIPNEINKTACLACAIDEIKYGSTLLYYIQNSYRGLVIAEAGILGAGTMVSQIMNYKDLDPAYDWTFVWNE